MTQLAGVNIAPASHPMWGALVKGESRPDYRCLALRIMMIRIRAEYDRDASKLQPLILELRRFFIANLRFAAHDYSSIFKEAAR